MEHKTRTKALSWLLSIAMLLSLVPGVSIPAYATEAAALTAETTTWENGNYVVSADTVTIGSHITVNGTVNLTLTEDTTLTANAGITLSDGATLNVSGEGTMVVNGSNENTTSTVAGSGVLVLNSGTLTATGGNGQSVGGWGATGNHGGVAVNGAVTVTGGTLIAKGGNGGGPNQSNSYQTGGDGGAAVSGDVTMTGGTIVATGGKGGNLRNGVGYSKGGAGGAAIGGALSISAGAMTVTRGSDGVRNGANDYNNSFVGAGGAGYGGTLTLGALIVLFEGTDNTGAVLDGNRESSRVYSGETKNVMYAEKPHIHSFTYAEGTGDKADTITAVCGGKDIYDVPCTLPLVDGKYTATLTIAAPDVGFEAKITDQYLIQGTAAVSYFNVDESGNKTGGALAGAPTDMGRYWAEITLGEGNNAATAHVVYEIAPIVLATTADWDAFADKVNGGNTYAGKVIQLADDIEVSKVVGDNRNHFFSGIFDGQNHTITANITNDSTPGGTALFRSIKDATIQNLKVGGTVTSNKNHVAAVAGFVENGNSTFENITVTAAVTHSANGYAGGLYGHGLSGTVIIRNCVFSGKINSNGVLGVFQGWADNGNKTTVENCLYIQQDGQATGNLAYVKNGTSTVTKGYKTGSTTDNNGTMAYTVIGTSDAKFGFGEGTTSANGLTILNNGAMQFDGVTYVPNDTNITVTAPDGYDIASITVNDEMLGVTCSQVGTYSFTMPAGDVIYNLTPIPAGMNGYAKISTPPNGVKQTYTGSPIDLVTAGAAVNGTVQYKLGDDGEWSETIPTATDCGEYTVYFKAVGDAQYADSEVGSVKSLIDGNGSKEFPCLITCVADWTEFVATLNDGDTKYVKLIADIKGCFAFNKSGATANLDLNGHTINGEQKGTVLTIQNGTLILDDSSADKTGAITGGYISGSNANGGGVSVTGGTFTMKNGTIAGNSSTNWGGGVFVQNATFTMENGSIKDNRTDRYGGGVTVVTGTFTMKNGTIQGNSAGLGGGGVAEWSNNGTTTKFDFQNGRILNNSAQVGGGVYLESALEMSGGSIEENTATGGAQKGGGIYIDNNNVTLKLSGAAVVKGNVSGGTITKSDTGYTLTGGTPCDVQHNIQNQLSLQIVGKLENGARIGVFNDNQTKAFTTGYRTYHAGDEADRFFFSNDSTRVIAKSYAAGTVGELVFFEIKDTTATLSVAGNEGTTCAAELLNADFSQVTEPLTVKTGERFILSVSKDDDYDFRITFQPESDVKASVKGFTIADNENYLKYAQEHNIPVSSNVNLFWVTMPGVSENLNITVTFKKAVTFTVLYQSNEPVNPAESRVWCKFALPKGNEDQVFITEMDHDATMNDAVVWSLKVTGGFNPTKVAFIKIARGTTMDSAIPLFESAQMTGVTAADIRQSVGWTDITGGKYNIIGGNAKTVVAAFVTDAKSLTVYDADAATLNIGENSTGVTYQMAVCVSDDQGNVMTHGTVTTPTAPTRTGYTFGGWRGFVGTAPNMKEEVLGPNQEVTVSENTIFHAVWNVASVNIEQNLNGGTGGSSVTSVQYGDLLTLPENPTREGFAFNNWAVSKSVTENGTLFRKGSVFDLNTPITADLGLTAQWKHVHSYSCYQFDDPVFGGALNGYASYKPYLHVRMCGCNDLTVESHSFSSGGRCACGYREEGSTEVELKISYGQWSENSYTVKATELPRKATEEQRVSVYAPSMWGNLKFFKWQFSVDKGESWDDLSSYTMTSFVIPCNVQLRALYVNPVQKPQVDLSVRRYQGDAPYNGSTIEVDSVLFSMDYKLPDGCTYVDAGVRLGDNAGICYYELKESKMSAGENAALSAAATAGSVAGNTVGELTGGAIVAAIAGDGKGIDCSKFFSGALSAFAGSFIENALENALEAPSYYYAKRENSALDELSAKDLGKYMYESKPVNVESVPPIYWGANAKTQGMSGSVNALAPVGFIHKNSGNHYIYGIAYLMYKDKTGKLQTIYTEALPTTLNSIPSNTVTAVAQGS